VVQEKTRGRGGESRSEGGGGAGHMTSRWPEFAAGCWLPRPDRNRGREMGSRTPGTAGQEIHHGRKDLLPFYIVALIMIEIT
jgi:hypothetical protein